MDEIKMQTVITNNKTEHLKVNGALQSWQKVRQVNGSRQLSGQLYENTYDLPHAT